MKPKLSLAASAQRPLRITPLPDPDRHQYRTTYERHLGLLLINDEPAAPAGLWDHFSPMVRGLLSRTLGPAEASRRRSRTSSSACTGDGDSWLNLNASASSSSAR